MAKFIVAATTPLLLAPLSIPFRILHTTIPHLNSKSLLMAVVCPLANLASLAGLTCRKCRVSRHDLVIW